MTFVLKSKVFGIMAERCIAAKSLPTLLWCSLFIYWTTVFTFIVQKTPVYGLDKRSGIITAKYIESIRVISF